MQLTSCHLLAHFCFVAEATIQHMLLRDHVHALELNVDMTESIVRSIWARTLPCASACTYTTTYTASYSMQHPADRLSEA